MSFVRRGGGGGVAASANHCGLFFTADNVALLPLAVLPNVTKDIVSLCQQPLDDSKHFFSFFLLPNRGNVMPWITDSITASGMNFFSLSLKSGQKTGKILFGFFF